MSDTTRTSPDTPAPVTQSSDDTTQPPSQPHLHTAFAQPQSRNQQHDLDIDPHSNRNANHDASNNTTDSSTASNLNSFLSNAGARLSAILPSTTPTFHIRKPSAAGLHLQTGSEELEVEKDNGTGHGYLRTSNGAGVGAYSDNGLHTGTSTGRTSLDTTSSNSISTSMSALAQAQAQASNSMPLDPGSLPLTETPASDPSYSYTSNPFHAPASLSTSMSRHSSLNRGRAPYARPPGSASGPGPASGSGSFEQFRSMSNACMSPPSSVASPMLHALRDVTPLPSPISRSPDAWSRAIIGRSRNNSAASAKSISAASMARDEAAGLLPPGALSSPPRRKKTYHLSGGSRDEGLPALRQDLRQEDEDARARNRSISEYKPEMLHNIRPRNITTPRGGIATENDTLAGSVEHPLHREQNFANRNKILQTALEPSPIAQLPSPPPSSKDTADDEEIDEVAKEIGVVSVKVGGRQRNWRPLRLLGRGAFSRVVLAAGEHAETIHEDDIEIPPLVAIKIQTHDPNARDEERMEASIQREIEMLQTVNHPNLPHLMGYEDDASRALLVLNYCAGGDLFDLASQRRDLLKPAMIQRIFSEMVDATLYLHEKWIVHRDIKLENVLVNIPIEELAAIEDPREVPQAVITLTDLGLSRHIPKPPADPHLQHPCGSPDYAAPEILLGQPYDGRATDAWALGVLLYALMEGRLPFDPPPGKRVTGNVKHRIARCDWLWCEYGDRFGEWVPEKGKELEGARQIVEGLLCKRGRWELERVKQHDFCAGGMRVQGRLRRSYSTRTARSSGTGNA